MFERFTEGARRVVELAQKEAGGLGHGYIGTEHLLLGLLGEESGVAAGVLRSAGVTLDDVRAEVERHLGTEPPTAADADALRAIGIDIEQVQASVEESFGPGALTWADHRRRLRATRSRRRRGRGRGRCVPRPGYVPFTPRSKRVLELSLREALQLRHNHIGTEHILLGLLREGQGLAAEVLADGGADLPELRRRTLSALGQVA